MVVELEPHGFALESCAWFFGCADTNNTGSGGGGVYSGNDDWCLAGAWPVKWSRHFDSAIIFFWTGCDTGLGFNDGCLLRCDVWWTYFVYSAEYSG